HPAGEIPRDVVALVPEVKRFEVLLRPLPRDARRNPVVAGLIDERIEVTLEHVQVDFLRHDADQRLRRLAFAVEIPAEHDDASARLRHERGDDTYRGRLAGAVRPEQREEI